jgi:hypothetical protein
MKHKLIMENWRKYQAKIVNESLEKAVPDISHLADNYSGILPRMWGLFERYATENGLGYLIIYNPFYAHTELEKKIVKPYISGAPWNIDGHSLQSNRLKDAILQWAKEENLLPQTKDFRKPDDEKIASADARRKSAQIDLDMELFANISNPRISSGINIGTYGSFKVGSERESSYTFLVPVDTLTGISISYMRDGELYPGGSVTYVQGKVGGGRRGAMKAIHDTGFAPLPGDITSRARNEWEETGVQLVPIE